MLSLDLHAEYTTPAPITADYAPVTPAPIGTCGWVRAPKNSDGRGGLLRITKTLANGDTVTRVYHVEPEYAAKKVPAWGAVTGWTMTTVEDAEAGKFACYAVSPAARTCTCGDQAYRGTKDAAHRCKHIRALGAALKAIGRG